MEKRYFVTPPIHGGNAWWQVRDSQSSKYWGENNFVIADFFKDIPNAESHANELAEKLNAES